MNATKTIGVVLGLVIACAIGAALYTRLGDRAPVASQGQSPKPEEAKQPEAKPDQAAKASVQPPEASSAGIQLYGAVIDAVSGAPIADADISLQKRERRGGDDSEESAQPTQTTSDEKGAYTLDVPEGEFRGVLCTAKGYSRYEQPLDTNTKGRVRVDFQLQPGGTVSGKVTDENDGTPLEGIMVRAFNSQQNFMEMMMDRERGGRGLRARTEADGTYVLDGVPVGSFRIVVGGRRVGYIVGPDDERQLEVAAGGVYEHVDFALSKGASVSGLVLDGSGQPVKDARVATIPTQFFQTAMRTLNTMNVDAFEGMDDRTDEQGRFEIIGLEYDTEYRARADADEYAGGASDAFVAKKGAPAPEVTVRLSKGSSVSGITRFASGDIAPNEPLLLFPVSREAWSGFQPPKEAKSSDKGEFTFKNVSAGEYLIRPTGHGMAMGAGFRDRTTPVTVEDGKDLGNLEVVVQTDSDKPEGTGVISGTVIAADGKPAGDIRVEARDPMMPMFTGGATTGADGTFTIQALNSQSYDVSVEDEKGIADVKGVAVGSTITLQLQPPARISGSVVTAQGDAVASCSVSLKNLAEDNDQSPQNIALAVRDLFDGGRGGANTDAYGHFEFTKVKPGRYLVSAKSTSSGTAESEEISISTGETVDTVRLVLDPGVSVSGVVVGPGGEPLAGASVQLTPLGTNQMADMMSAMMPAGMVKTAGATMTGPTGEFTMSRVPAGQYKLSGSHSTFARTSTTVTVNKGVDVTGVRLALQKPGKARGTYAVNGKPQPNVMIMAMGPNGVQMTQTNAQGEFDISGLSSGSYMVTAFDPAQFAEASQNGMQFTPRVIDVSEGQVAEVDMGGGADVAAGSAPVSGTISGTNGTTVVALRRPGGPSMENINVLNISDMIESLRYLEGQTIVNGDGTFSLDGVKPGEYVLEVYSMDANIGRPGMLGMMNNMPTPVYRETISVGAEHTPVNIDLTP
ncbi:MAG: carboxypeptidase-like regulatory domain-containing protein [Candidatus Hydrogenedentes bacterium]|nr:carboxypeptidase-like regulatory domain-containing protein [Candidatus Hydrogenedentota bacterium]